MCRRSKAIELSNMIYVDSIVLLYISNTSRPAIVGSVKWVSLAVQKKRRKNN